MHRVKYWSILSSKLKADALQKAFEGAVARSGYKVADNAKDALSVWVYRGDPDGSIVVVEGKESASTLLAAVAQGAGSEFHSLRGEERKVRTKGQSGEFGFHFESRKIEDTTAAHGDFDETGLHYMWLMIDDLPADCTWRVSLVPALAPRLLGFVRAIEGAGAWTIASEGARHMVSVNSAATGKQALSVDDAELASLRAATAIAPG